MKHCLTHTLLCILDSVWILCIVHWTSISRSQDSERCLSLWTVTRTQHWNISQQMRPPKLNQPSAPLLCWIHGCTSLDNNFSLSTRWVSPYQILHVTGDVRREREEERKRVNWMTWMIKAQHWWAAHTELLLCRVYCEAQVLQCWHAHPNWNIKNISYPIQTIMCNKRVLLNISECFCAFMSNFSWLWWSLVSYLISHECWAEVYSLCFQWLRLHERKQTQTVHRLHDRQHYLSWQHHVQRIREITESFTLLMSEDRMMGNKMQFGQIDIITFPHLIVSNHRCDRLSDNDEIIDSDIMTSLRTDLESPWWFNSWVRVSLFRQ